MVKNEKLISTGVSCYPAEHTICPHNNKKKNNHNFYHLNGSYHFCSNSDPQATC